MSHVMCDNRQFSVSESQQVNDSLLKSKAILILIVTFMTVYVYYLSCNNTT